MKAYTTKMVNVWQVVFAYVWQGGRLSLQYHPLG